MMLGLGCCAFCWFEVAIQALHLCDNVLLIKKIGFAPSRHDSKR
jgi:hypothetical protein